MPIHLFEWKGAEKRFRSVREFDHSDLTDTPLDLDLRDAKYSVIVLAAICPEYSDSTQLLELQALEKVNGKCQLGCARINERSAGNFLPPSLGRQEAVLPVPDLYRNREDAQSNHLLISWLFLPMTFSTAAAMSLLVSP